MTPVPWTCAEWGLTWVPIIAHQGGPILSWAAKEQRPDGEYMLVTLGESERGDLIRALGGRL